IDSGSNKAALGSQAHDTASVTSTNNAFTRTGTLSYQLYTGLSCTSGNELNTANVQTMSTGTVPNSAETAALGAGNYSYQATYSGDGNYATSTGSCEPFTVNAAAPNTRTFPTRRSSDLIDSGSNKAALGSQAHDTASVTSTNNAFT